MRRMLRELCGRRLTQINRDLPLRRMIDFECS
jgi:hypothetical protein